jgi:hypothetical protein
LPGQENRIRRLFGLPEPLGGELPERLEFWRRLFLSASSRAGHFDKVGSQMIYWQDFLSYDDYVA